jgi:hypothetical protein
MKHMRTPACDVFFAMNVPETPVDKFVQIKITIAGLSTAWGSMQKLLPVRGGDLHGVVHTLWAWVSPCAVWVFMGFPQAIAPSTTTTNF